MFNSVNRLYGTFYNPDFFAVFSLTGIILCLKHIDTNIIYKIILYINTLVLFLTISKSVLIFFIIVLAIMVFLNKENVWIFLSLLFPIMINLNLYRVAFLSNFPIIFIIGTIFLICLYLLLYLLKKQHFKIYLFILFIFFCLCFVFPTADLKLYSVNNNLSNANKYIVDFYNLNDKKYNLEFDVSGSNILGKVYLYENFIENNVMNRRIVSVVNLDKKIKITLKSNNKAEYYSLAIRNDGDMVTVSNVRLISDFVIKKYDINYNILPYTYVKSIERLKYDSEWILGRIDIYKDCINIIRDDLFLGHGYLFFKNHSQENKFSNYLFVEHSYIFTLGVQNGIFAIIIWICLLFLMFFNCIRVLNRQNVYYIMIVFLLMFFSLFDFILNQNYFLILLFSLSIYLLNDKHKDILFLYSENINYKLLKHIGVSIDI